MYECVFVYIFVVVAGGMELYFCERRPDWETTLADFCMVHGTTMYVVLLVGTTCHDGLGWCFTQEYCHKRTIRHGILSCQRFSFPLSSRKKSMFLLRLWWMTRKNMSIRSGYSIWLVSV